MSFTTLKAKCTAGALAGTLVLGFAVSVAAETSVSGSAEVRANVGANTETKKSGPPVRAQIKENREAAEEVREKAREAVNENREEIRNIREEAREDIDDDRDDIREIRKGTSTLATSTRREMIKNKLDDIRDVRKDAWEKIKTEREEIKVAKKGRLEATQQQKVAATINLRLRKLGQAIETVSKFITKIEERITVFKARGAVTASADAQIVIAKSKLQSAKDKLLALQVTASTTANSSTPKEDLEKLRASFDAVTTDIRGAHKAGVEAIVSLKGMSVRATTTASTTVSTGTTTNQ